MVQSKFTVVFILAAAVISPVVSLPSPVPTGPPEHQARPKNPRANRDRA